MVIYVNDQKSCMDILLIATCYILFSDKYLHCVTYASIVHPPNTATVKAIFMNEINDRPSSYFFQFSNKLRNDVPFFKDRAVKDLFSAVKKFGTSVGVAVRPKNLNSVHMGADVRRSAASCIFSTLGFHPSFPSFVSLLRFHPSFPSFVKKHEVDNPHMLATSFCSATILAQNEQISFLVPPFLSSILFLLLLILVLITLLELNHQPAT
jgi:hypothetical protein